jgi:hypothetical protein
VVCATQFRREINVALAQQHLSDNRSVILKVVARLCQRYRRTPKNFLLAPSFAHVLYYFDRPHRAQAKYDTSEHRILDSDAILKFEYHVIQMAVPHPTLRCAKATPLPTRSRSGIYSFTTHSPHLYFPRSEEVLSYIGLGLLKQPTALVQPRIEPSLLFMAVPLATP